MKDEVKPSFNLLDEPWIPVRTQSAALKDVSLADALINAGEYTALGETAPPNMVALYRLLLAALHRALTTEYGPWKDIDRVRWFREGLPQAAIGAYLERWRMRFWLFHATHPFMQVAALASAQETKDRLKPWTQIAIDKPSPSEPTLFDHALDAQPACVSYARALREMLGYLQFVTGKLVKCFKPSDKAGALANTAAVIPLGKSLHETLLLALHPYDARRPDDLPAWERPALELDQLRAAPVPATGPNDRYTRLSRSVLLQPEVGAACMRYIRFGAGLALADQPEAPDRMAFYRVVKGGKAAKVSFREGRAVWRDLPSLLPAGSRLSDSTPAVLDSAGVLLDGLGAWEATIPVLVAGLASDKAKLLRWRAERLELPAAIVLQANAATELRAQLEFAEEAYNQVRTFCAQLITNSMPNPAHQETRKQAKRILATGPTAFVYFSSLELALPELMQQISVGAVDAAVRDWQKNVAMAARKAWEATLQNLGDSPLVLRADARIWPRFYNWMTKLLGSHAEPTTKEAS